YRLRDGDGAEAAGIERVDLARCGRLRDRACERLARRRPTARVGIVTDARYPGARRLRVGDRGETAQNQHDGHGDGHTDAAHDGLLLSPKPLCCTRGRYSVADSITPRGRLQKSSRAQILIARKSTFSVRLDSCVLNWRRTMCKAIAFCVALGLFVVGVVPAV